jgi:hypothetical protein
MIILILGIQEVLKLLLGPNKKIQTEAVELTNRENQKFLNKTKNAGIKNI